MYKWQKNAPAEYHIIDVDDNRIVAIATDRFIAALICGSVNAWLFKTRKPFDPKVE